MKLATLDRHLEVLGDAEDVEMMDFLIEANGKAFRTLIDGMYSDKIGSIVRELLSNAYDAQVRGQWTGAFFVHAPSEARAEFFVRDYGCGMTHETVRTLYRTLFASDKDQTNDEVGAKGLGAKSPWAYADQFFLSCYDGEEVRHYTCAIGPKDRPMLILSHREPCAEPRGVRVGLAVEEKDFATFADAIRRNSLGFTHRFESNIDLPSLGEPEVQGAGWASYKGYNLPARFNVRQGCVIYPLTSTGGLTVPNDANRQYLIECPIGTVQVTSSRELIEYKEEVVAYLQARIDAIKAELSDLVWNKVKDIHHVGAFFAKVTELRPPFVDAKRFVHPGTGLESPHVNLTDPALFFRASYVSRDEAWTYTEHQQHHLSAHSHGNAILIVTDFDSLRDPAGYASIKVKRSRFSRTENRRIKQLARAWCTANRQTAVEFAIGFDFTDEFWAACYPQTLVQRITVAELRRCIPKPVRRPREVIEASKGYAPAIRGIGVVDVSREASTPEAVSEIDTSLKTGWIAADDYRRCPAAYKEIARKAGLTHITIASVSVQGKVQEAGLPTLAEAMRASLPLKASLKQFNRLLMSGHSGSNHLNDFAYAVFKRSPAQYDRLERAHGLLGPIFKTLRPFLATGAYKADGEARAALSRLFKDADDKGSTKVEKLLTDLGKVSINYNPINDYLEDTQRVIKDEKGAGQAVDGLLALAKIFDPTVLYTYR